VQLTTLDWTIIATYLIGCMAAGLWMRRYVRSVEDFAVAGRSMDLNLGIASLAATEMGIVTVMFTAEMGFKNGFAGATPGVLFFLAMLGVGMTGFVIVPLRDAGVITIPELFEKRFGKSVRWLSGLVMALGGLLNMGIFLRLGGEFLVHAVGLDPGWLKLTMGTLLVLVLTYTILGGMLSVLITDYLQFLVMGLGIVLVSIWVIGTIGWSELVGGLADAYAAQPPASSGGIMPILDHPFNPLASVGGWWLVWQMLLMVAGAVTWQPTITRVLSANSAATAKRIYCRTSFYFVGRFALPGLWGAAAFVYFWSHGGLPDGLDSRTATPAFLGQILPAGLIGMLLAAMLAAEMSTDSGYLLTWATVIYNDLVMPCFRRPVSQRARLLTMRILVLAIAAFLLFYGLLYEIPGRAWDYVTVTATIYQASMLTLLVSVLYWRGAHRWGAYAAIVLGAAGPIAFLAINFGGVQRVAPEVAGLSAFGLAFSGMLVGSWLGRRFGQKTGNETGMSL